MNVQINVDLVRSKLAERGMKQATLAAAAKIEKRTFEGILQRGTAALSSAHGIANALNIPIKEILIDVRDTDTVHTQIEPLEGVIWFGRVGGEEKDKRGGRFNAEIAFRAMVTGTNKNVRLKSLQLDCIDKRGVYAGRLGQIPQIIIDKNGTAATQNLATIAGHLVNEIVLVPNQSLVLGITSEFMARVITYPYQWDFGFLRLRGFDGTEDPLFDETFSYGGARFIERSELPTVPWFSDDQIETFLDMGYMNEAEEEILKSVPPDERLLHLWDTSHELQHSPLVRKVVDDIMGRLRNDAAAFSADRGSMTFPPPFKPRTGKARVFVVTLHGDQYIIKLPSIPIRDDLIMIVVRGIHLKKGDFTLESNRVILSPSWGNPLNVQVVYIEKS